MDAVAGVRVRSLGAACAAAVVLALTACTPTGEGSPTSSASADAPPSAASTPAPSADASVEPVEMEELGEEAYPGEVGGFTLNWLLGKPVYDITGDGAVTQRVVVDPQVWNEPAARWRLGAESGHEELRPGVWCYVYQDDDQCAGNSASGRFWITTDMFDTLTPDELAAWTESFVAEVP